MTVKETKVYVDKENGEREKGVIIATFPTQRVMVRLDNGDIKNFPKTDLTIIKDD